jgi:hypothetical protein
MVNKDKHNDGFFRELFALDKIEKAPEGFADRVMNIIDAENAVVGEERWSWSGWWLWASILFAIASLVAIVFFIDFSFMGNIFEGLELDGSRMSQFFSNLGNGLIAAFEGFTVSSITVTIVIAIGALFLIERLLRRKPDMELPII